MSTCADVMSTHVYTLSPDEPVHSAAGKLLRARVSGCPVVGPDRRVVGVISELDLMRALYPATQGEVPTGTVRDHMTPTAIGLAPETPLIDAAHFFFEYPVRRAPVLDANGHLVGIVARYDVLHALEEQTRQRRLSATP